jgi:predicted aconitase
LQLSVFDQERLDGKHGQAMQFAMETVVSAARIDRAGRWSASLAATT